MSSQVASAVVTRLTDGRISRCDCHTGPARARGRLRDRCSRSRRVLRRRRTGAGRCVARYERQDRLRHYRGACRHDLDDQQLTDRTPPSSSEVAANTTRNVELSPDGTRFRLQQRETSSAATVSTRSAAQSTSSSLADVTNDSARTPRLTTCARGRPLLRRRGDLARQRPSRVHADGQHHIDVDRPRTGPDERRHGAVRRSCCPPTSVAQLSRRMDTARCSSHLAPMARTRFSSRMPMAATGRW